MLFDNCKFEILKMIYFTILTLLYEIQKIQLLNKKLCICKNIINFYIILSTISSSFIKSNFLPKSFSNAGKHHFDVKNVTFSPPT